MKNQPLADRLRPTELSMMVGQSHLFGKNGSISRLLDSGRVGNMIFYGPPGTGKTTAADIIAHKSGLTMYRLNATTASLSDVRDVVSQTSNVFGAGGILLYLDEIQYFNRKQQQSLLEYIEDGRVTLISSTTENPYYYIYNAIISRSSVFEFKPVPPDECAKALRRAWDFLNSESGRERSASDEMLGYLASRCGGDVRRGITMTENAYYMTGTELLRETADCLSAGLPGAFDRDGDTHYDLLSGLQKSIRGSDPDAAVFYLAKLLAGGDLISACRRLQVIASEDVGQAYPLAAVITRSCCESAVELGLPEGAIPLANAAVMLATSPKSNSSYLAYNAALADVNAGLGQKVPRHLHSPSFEGYVYPHDFPHHYTYQQYLPDDIKDKHYFTFGDSKNEAAAEKYREELRGGKSGTDNKDKN